MLHSTLTRKGQTTIPSAIRNALKAKPGDTFEYLLDGDTVTLRVHAGTRALRGALTSKKGKNMSFAEIRAAAALAAPKRKRRS